MGRTAPSWAALTNLLRCQAVAKGPVSALTVAHYTGGDQIGIIQDRAERVGEAIAQLSALIDAARRLRSHMAGDAARGKRTV